MQQSRTCMHGSTVTMKFTLVLWTPSVRTWMRSVHLQPLLSPAQTQNLSLPSNVTHYPILCSLFICFSLQPYHFCPKCLDWVCNLLHKWDNAVVLWFVHSDARSCLPLVFNHCMKIPHFISSTVLRHLDCFYGFAITSSTPVSVSAQASWCMCVPKNFPRAERGNAITGSRVQ